MKVVLTAFQGKLRSEPMDWPEGTSGVILMRMDLERPNWALDRDSSNTITSSSITTHMCRFEETGYYLPVSGDPYGAREYRLVGLR